MPLLRGRFFCYRTVESTQSVAAAWLASGIGPVTLIAQEQTAGRGRARRVWRDTRGGLSLSFATVLPSAWITPMLSLVMAAILRDLVSAETGILLGVKWPNDLYFQSQKIGGILLDARTKGNNTELVCGLGLNVNQTVFSTELLGQATSLRLLAGRTLDTISLGWQLSERLARLFSEEIPLQRQQWQDRVNDALCFVGQTVKLEGAQASVVGILEGIDHLGHVCLRVNGKKQSYDSGSLYLQP